MIESSLTSPNFALTCTISPGFPEQTHVTFVALFTCSVGLRETKDFDVIEVRVPVDIIEGSFPDVTVMVSSANDVPSPVLGVEFPSVRDLWAD